MYHKFKMYCTYTIDIGSIKKLTEIQIIQSIKLIYTKN